MRTGSALVTDLARALIDGLDEPALLVKDSRIVAANAAVRDLLGRAVEGAGLADALGQPDLSQAVLDQEPRDLELAGIGGPGRKWLVSVRSIADGVRLVRLIDRSAYRAAERMRVDFVANASHELRTPLATLVGYAETLRDHSVDAPTRERFLSTIHDEAKRMQRLVEDLISLSRIESERFSPPSEPIDIGELIAEAIGHWLALAHEHMTEIRLLRQTEVLATTGDRNQLLQLLDNLISNALRYGRAGTPVTVNMAQDGGMARITVSDEGEGIAAKHIPRITERFYRVDKARSRDSGGTGLGLSIVKHIVERHRGRLDIHSTVGSGTDVHVFLPLTKSSAPGTRRPRSGRS